MSKFARNVIISFAILCGIGVFFVPLTVQARTSFAQKPILSVLGDSISSYYGYEGFVVYGPSGSETAFDMDKSNMWWSLYSEERGYTIGWSSSVGMSSVSVSSNDYLSLNNETRIDNLDKNGNPDVIAIFGGVNDTWSTKASSTTFEAAYSKLVSTIHSLFKDVKLILLAPYHYPLQGYSQQNSMIDGYDSVIGNIARRNGDYYVDLREISFSNTDFFDDIHPNESGMCKIANAVEAAMNPTGITNIRADLDYNKYTIKVNAYDPNYDNLRFKFKLTNNKTGAVIYDTGWQKDNCFPLDAIDTTATYSAHAEIDNNNDDSPEATFDKTFSNLISKRTGTTIYNGVDYSAVYNFNYYVENYGDLYNVYRNNPYGALEHFVNYGMNEGRRACANFDVHSYRNQYGFLRAMYGWNNLPAYYMHFINTGYKAGWNGTGCNQLQDAACIFWGVDFSSVYNYQYYVDHNPDVKVAFEGDDNSVFNHFLLYGIKEGRQGASSFNVTSYRNQYADLRQAFGWDNIGDYYLHYINFGRFEGRAGTGCIYLQNPIHMFFGVDFAPIYDYQYYIDNNLDVKNAFNGNDVAVFSHFLTNGIREGRKASANFDVNSYRNQYADLRQIFGWNDLLQYYMHYLNFGVREGRAGTGCTTLQNPIHTFFGVDFSSVYDYEYYKSHYPDLVRAFGDDDMAYFNHFICNGMWEGRRGNGSFDLWTYVGNYADLRNAFGWNLPSYYLHYVTSGRNEGRMAV